MSLDEEKKKAIIAAQRHPLVSVTRNPTTSASRAPEELSDFLLSPHNAIADGKRTETSNLKGDTAIVYQVSRVTHVTLLVLCSHGNILCCSSYIFAKMPAKKKKGDKKGDKKAKDGPAAPEKSLEELDPPISDTTKEFYLIQVRDLEAKLEKYKVKCDELQAKYDGLSKTHSQSVKDRDDIIALLKKDLQSESDR